MKKKNSFWIAHSLLKEAVKIATSKEPVTDDRLIVGEFLVDLASKLLKNATASYTHRPSVQGR